MRTTDLSADLVTRRVHRRLAVPCRGQLAEENTHTGHAVPELVRYL